MPADFLEKQDTGEESLPIWIPPTGKFAGFHTWKIDRAVNAGLKFRPIKTICKDTLEWVKTLPAEKQAKTARAFDPAKEAEILKSLG